jgi:DNA-binding transcriptional ArsR family regulator
MHEKEVKVFKALSNETRLKILKWLKEPKEHFPPQGLHIPKGDSFANSVCVGSIKDKAGVSQSVASHYLTILQKAGLLESARFGKWTYYRRNEANIRKFAEKLQKDL